MNAETVTIGLVDDHTLFRQTLAEALNNSPGTKVVLQAGNGKELQEALRRGPAPQLLLLDIVMPVMDGFETLQWLSAERPELPVVTVSGCDTVYTQGTLISLGVRCILKKNVDLAELNKSIRHVLEEGYCFTGKGSVGLLKALYNKKGSHELYRQLFTDEEWKLLQLSGTDLTYQQIAALMGKSERGIDKIRNRLFEKLSVNSRQSLAMAAERHGIKKGSRK